MKISSKADKEVVILDILLVLDTVLVLILVLKTNVRASLCLPILMDVIWWKIDTMFLKVAHGGEWNFK